MMKDVLTPISKAGSVSPMVASVLAVVLAAGKGTRMKSVLPKVLHRVAGIPIAEHVLRALRKSGVKDIALVLSPETAPFRMLLENFPEVLVCTQNRQAGTGDAVAAVASLVQNAKRPPYASGAVFRGQPVAADYILVTAGDTPALDPEVLKSFMATSLANGSDVAVLAMRVPRPYGYGRVVVEGAETNGALVRSIIEERDADEVQKQIKLCNSGVIFAKSHLLFELLCDLTTNNAQGEYYLTDIVAAANKRQKAVKLFATEDWEGFAGINDRQQLATVEQSMIAKYRRNHMLAGVSFALPETTYVETDVVIGADTWIGPNVSLGNSTRIGQNCRIGAGAVIEAGVVGDGVIVPPKAVVSKTTLN